MSVWSLRNPYFIESLVWPRVSLLSIYFKSKENVFLNTRHKNTSRFDPTDYLLWPYHYLFDGKTIVRLSTTQLGMIFTYSAKDSSYLKSAAAIVGLIPGIIFGSAFKGLAIQCSLEARRRYIDALEICCNPHKIYPVDYQKLAGVPELFSSDPAPCQNFDYGRFSYDYLISQKSDTSPIDPAILALKEGKRFPHTARQQCEINALCMVAKVLNEKRIPWWLEAGTALGAFRDKDNIPWDHDVDIAIPHTEFENTHRALKGLDPQKYEIQDWSPDIHRNAYLRLFVKETQTHLDIYVFNLDVSKRTLTYIGMTQYTNMPQWFKELDNGHVIPFSLEDIFPLRPTKFAGVDVWLPNKVQEYLQDKYASKAAGRKGPITNINPNVYWNPVQKKWIPIETHTYRPYLL